MSRGALIAIVALLLCASVVAKDGPPQYPVVLAWHQFVESAEDLEPAMPVAQIQEFEQTLIWLRDNGVRTLTIDEYCDAIRSPEPPRDAVLLTVDDGYQTVYTELLPLLEKYGAHLVSFVVTDRVGQENKVNPGQPWLTWDECRELQASGLVDIEAHAARSHQQIKGKGSAGVVLGPWLTTRLWDPTKKSLEPEETWRKRVREEFVNARQHIESELGRMPRTFCWPYGVSNEYAREACRQAGFEATFALKQVTGDPTCRRRYHCPEDYDKARALIAKHPKPMPRPESESAESERPAPQAALEPTRTAQASTAPEIAAAAALPAAPGRSPWALLLAAGGGVLVWGVLYLLLFRGGD